MSEDGETGRLLPTSRAFVLQIRADSRVEDGHLAGRAEHIVSGNAAHFESVNELLTFIVDALQEADSTTSEEC